MEIKPRPFYHWHQWMRVKSLCSSLCSERLTQDQGTISEPRIKGTLGASLMEGVRLLGTQAKAWTMKHQTGLSCVEPAPGQFIMEDLGHLVLPLRGSHTCLISAR